VCLLPWPWWPQGRAFSVAHRYGMVLIFNLFLPPPQSPSPQSPTTTTTTCDARNRCHRKNHSRHSAAAASSRGEPAANLRVQVVALATKQSAVRCSNSQTIENTHAHIHTRHRLTHITRRAQYKGKGGNAAPSPPQTCSTRSRSIERGLDSCTLALVLTSTAVLKRRRHPSELGAESFIRTQSAERGPGKVSKLDTGYMEGGAGLHQLHMSERAEASGSSAAEGCVLLASEGYGMGCNPPNLACQSPVCYRDCTCSRLLLCAQRRAAPVCEHAASAASRLGRAASTRKYPTSPRHHPTPPITGMASSSGRTLDSHPMYPCAKLKLDQLFLQWLSLPDSQALVRLHTFCCWVDSAAAKAGGLLLS